jgi:hypothetical protein
MYEVVVVQIQIGILPPRPTPNPRYFFFSFLHDGTRLQYHRAIHVRDALKSSPLVDHVGCKWAVRF